MGAVGVFSDFDADGNEVTWVEPLSDLDTFEENQIALDHEWDDAGEYDDYQDEGFFGSGED